MINEDKKHQMLEFVRAHPLGTLGMLNDQDKPWGVVVYFGADSQFNLYFITKTSTAKHQYLQRNPEVSVVFMNEAKQETLQVQGEALMADSSSQNREVEEALRRIVPKTDDWTLPIVKLKEGKHELYKVVVSYAKLTWYGDKRQGETPTTIEYRVDELTDSTPLM